MQQDSFSGYKKRLFSFTQALLDRVWLAGLVAMAGILIVIAGLFVKTDPYYTADATIIFEKNLPEILYTDREKFIHSFEDWMRTQVHEIESNDVLDSAITRYEASGFHWTLPGESRKTAVDRLRARLSVSQINNTQIMALSLSSKEKSGLSELVNLTIDSYIRFKDEQRQQLDREKLSYLKTERQEVEKRLEGLYQELTAISRRYGTAVADEKNLYIYLNMFMDLRAKYNGVLVNRIHSEAQMNALQGKKLELEQLSIRDPKENQTFLQAEKEILERLNGLKPGTSQYNDLKSLLNDIREKDSELVRDRLLSQVAIDLADHEAQFNASLSSQSELEKELKKAQMEVMEFNTAVIRASTKRQEIDRIIELWNRINSRLEQINIEMFNPGSVRILNYAQTPDFPDETDRNKKLIMGFAGSVFGGVGLVILMAWFDPKIRRPSDIKKVFGIEPGGFLLADSEKGNPSILAFNTHQLYKIASRLEMDHEKNGSKIFFFTTPDYSHQLPTLVMNLTDILGDSGSVKKVIILDPPAVESDVEKKTDLPVSVNRFSMDLKLNTRLLHQIKTTIKQSAGVSDFILIAGLPFNHHPFNHQLADLADVTILVVDSASDKWPVVVRTVELIRQSGTKAFSMVLNRVRPLRNGYYRQLLKGESTGNPKVKNG